MPFLQYYAVFFLLFETSTIFLDLHWFFDKVGVKNSWIVIVNGVVLITSFFFCRIVFGFYYSYQFWRDVVAFEVDGVYKEVGIPIYLPVYYQVANILLNVLNVYWFFVIIHWARKRGKKVAQE